MAFRAGRNAVAAVRNVVPRVWSWPDRPIGVQRDQPLTGLVHAVPVMPINPAQAGSPIAEGLYRIFEVVAAGVGLVLCLPVMALVAILIRFDSPGPVLFTQPRTTRSRAITGEEAQNASDLIAPPEGFRPDQLYYVPAFFRFIKFRTMYSDARTRFPDLYAYRYEQEEFHQRRFKEEEDPRVTRLGRWLRRLTLDELPNLWCVVCGSMRLVGPRPEISEVLKYYWPEEMYKFAVKPGITGLAQINGRGNLNWGETIGWDMEYVRTRSIALDLKIIALTLWYVLVRRGAF